MRESSPAVGGVMVGAAILFALAYSLGDSDKAMAFLSVLAAFGNHLIETAYLAVGQVIGS